MIQKNKLVSSVICFLFVLLVIFANLANPQTARASGYITIDYPSSGSSLSGSAEVGGIVMGNTVFWIGLYLSNHGLMLTNTNCHLTAFPSYSCLWDTRQVTDGPHTIMTATTIDGITVYSQSIEVIIANGGAITPTPTPSVTPTLTVIKTTPTPESTTTPKTNIETTPAPEAETTLVPVPGRPAVAKRPGAMPTTSPSAIPTTEDLVAGSQLLVAIEYSLDQEKPLHLAKIEERISLSEQKFLLFIGKSYPDSFLMITINSQPLVMTAKADSTSNWNYILEKPLEPGQHEVLIEVNRDGQIEQSGPYPFNVARAQAGPDNPLGASLGLINPQKQALRNYLYLAAGLVGLAMLALFVYYYFKKIKKLKKSPPPLKEPSAI